MDSGLKKSLVRSYLVARSEVGQVNFLVRSFNRASEMFSLNRKYPPISKFNSPCNEFVSVWSMFVYNTTSFVSWTYQGTHVHTVPHQTWPSPRYHSWQPGVLQAAYHRYTGLRSLRNTPGTSMNSVTNIEIGLNNFRPNKTPQCYIHINKLSC